MACRNIQLTLALLALVLAVKLLVPAGFMISATSDRFLTVTICADASGISKQMRIAIPSKNDRREDHSKAAGTGQPCSFSGLSHAALGGTDPILLAAALTFVLLLGFAPPRTLPQRGIAFLRPPLRGPPSLTR
ncbi:MAG: hypothetical protein U5J78_00160 [Parasphingorhabdus sp.]|nr:hypothetical protein [Parasphingorhabdus sp.]